MHILIIANGYPDKRAPQWGCFERDQALALSKTGHQVSILYVDRRWRTFWRKIGTSCFRKEGLSVYGLFLLPGKVLKLVMTKPLYQCFVTWMYDRLFRLYVAHEGMPDIIYAHYLYNIFYASTLKQRYGVPLVGIEHWSELAKEQLSSKVKYWGENAYSNVDKLLVVSQSLQSHIYKHFKKESTVVYDMLGQEFVSSKVKKKEEKSQPFRFVAVGSLIHRKGFDLLLQAFCRSGLKEKGCSIVIIGDGPEKTNLFSLAKLLGVSEYVCLAGRKTKDEIISEMQQSHVFVLSSRAETFGVVCIEALSQGLPNIATVCGGPEEFINEKNGILVPTDNVEALSEAMVNLYNNYSKFDSMAIADECKRRFAPQVIAGQLTTIFEGLINK